MSLSERVFRAEGDDGQCFSSLSRKRIHDRLPMMLLPDDYDRWLHAAMSVDDSRSMLKPYDAGLMHAYEVSRAVSSVKNETPECVEPVGK